MGNYQDDAYLRDGLGQLLACDAMLMGRRTYEILAAIYSTLETAGWENSTIVRSDVATEVAKLKAQDGQDLLIWGHGQLAETLLKAELLDVIDMSIYPVIAGRGKPFRRDGQNAALRLVAAKTFAKGIVKITYEPQR